MTEPNPLGRIDLRAIDEPTDTGQMDRVVANALRHLTSADLVRKAGLLDGVGVWARPAIAAAVIVAVGATAVIRWTDTRSPVPTIRSLSAWTEAGRVPTNGELLTAFEGYVK